MQDQVILLIRAIFAKSPSLPVIFLQENASIRLSQSDLAPQQVHQSFIFYLAHYNNRNNVNKLYLYKSTRLP